MSQDDKALTTVLSDDNEHACPVCLCNPSQELRFLSGHCAHAVCERCMERILLSPHYSDHEISAPTVGKCPICRSELRLFELRECSEKNMLAYPKDTNVAQSPIGGLVYVERHRGTGPAFHFDDIVPCVKFSSEELLDDGTTVPATVAFDEGCHWHEKSRTFHGTLSWTNGDATGGCTYHGAHKWDVILQFSSDLRYISNGILIKHQSDDKEDRWPLDGRWIVDWETGYRARIHVQRNRFQHESSRYVLDLSDPRRPRFEWPSTFQPRVVQTATEGVDLEAQPEGPPVGSRIIWNLVPPVHERIIWTRESVGGVHVERFGPGGRMYHRLDASVQTRPTFVGDTLFGNAFCQGLKVGLASYHFKSDGEAYISYEHPHCAQWPPLDDGTPVPLQVSFRNVSFDEVERVFRGAIEWQEEYGTTWQGCRKWIYEMKFDSEYTCIVSGVVKSISRGNHQEQEMSSFGMDLIYINAAVLEKFRSPESGDNVLEESEYDRYSRRSRELRTRLQSEGASVRTMAMMHHVLTEAQQPESEPIDFNL